MKKIIHLLIVLVVCISCNNDTNYVTFSGKIKNNTADSLIIFNPGTNFKKSIKLNKDGTFKDTLKLKSAELPLLNNEDESSKNIQKVENGLFSLTNNIDFSLLYLANGDHIVMNFDEKNFNESLSFSGSHALENDFLGAAIAKEIEFFSDRELMRLPKKDFDEKLANYVKEVNAGLANETLEKEFLEHQKNEIKDFKKYIENEYLEKNYVTLFLEKGKPSPKFINYENYNGTSTSLDDLKGKYVYIDVWATWCNPCIREIPSLQKIEEQYHGKNIEFVSISIDEKKDYEAWRKMVVDEKLGGTQLYSKRDQSFMSAYKISSIPRFILIDPEGNIVNADAPRPSRPELEVLLNSLNI